MGSSRRDRRTSNSSKNNPNKKDAIDPNKKDAIINPSKGLWIGVLLGAVVAGIIPFSSSWFSTPGIDRSHQHRLPNKTWSLQTKMRITSERTPCRLIESPTTLWKASDTRWTKEYLQHVFEKESGSSSSYLLIKERSPPIFIHHDPTCPLAHEFPPSYQSKSRSMAEFMNLLVSNDDNRSREETHALPRGYGYYYHAEVASWSPSLLSDIHPREDLILSETTTKARETSEDDQSMVKIWIGTPGVVANLHYDATHNFFHQVHGTKEFLLLPPEAWMDLSIFSRLHPSHRQSQINDTIWHTLIELLKAGEESHPRVEGFIAQHVSTLLPHISKIMVVKLFPGDTMYIPPFWFHHVVTGSLDFSISVNIWSNSREVNGIQSVLQNPLPYLDVFEYQGWVVDTPSHMFYLAFYLSNLSLAVFRHRSIEVQHFLWTVVENYMRSINVLVRKEDIPPFSCSSSSDQLYMEQIEAQQKMMEFIRQTNEHIFQPMPSNTRSILFASYIEALLAEYMNPEFVHAFIYHCLYVPLR